MFTDNSNINTKAIPIEEIHGAKAQRKPTKTVNRESERPEDLKIMGLGVG